MPMNVVIVSVVVEEEEVVEGEVEVDVEDTWEVGEDVVEEEEVDVVVVAAAEATHLETKRMVPLQYSLETKLHLIKSATSCRLMGVWG